jgi:xylulokinase
VVTVGIDIGTTATKTVAADADGEVVARARVPHTLKASHPGELAHDAAEAWWHGPRTALAQLVDQLGDPSRIAAVEVAAMVPSLCAVGPDGVPISDGLLYGDDRGAGGDDTANPSESGELVRFLASLVATHPDAAGYWPAQAVANHALSGIGALDTTTAMTTLPLFDFVGWDDAVAKGAGLDDTSKLPTIVSGADAVGPVSSLPDAILASGTIDAMGEQMVAGADRVGDVLVIFGATLITWAVVAEWCEFPGLWTVPHTAPGLSLVGGPSNAGGLFMNWVKRLIGDAGDDDRPARSARVPVFQPYLRGERVPFHDRNRRASLHGLDIGCDRPEIRRAAREASGFAIRQMLDIARLEPNRIVATGGGTHDEGWIQAVADATRLPVDVVAVPEGAALGTAYLARVTAGLEQSAANASRWSRIGRRVEPDPAWVDDVAVRYGTYRELTGA